MRPVVTGSGAAFAPGFRESISSTPLPPPFTTANGLWPSLLPTDMSLSSAPPPTNTLSAALSTTSSLSSPSAPFPGCRRLPPASRTQGHHHLLKHCRHPKRPPLPSRCRHPIRPPIQSHCLHPARPHLQSHCRPMILTYCVSTTQCSPSPPSHRCYSHAASELPAPRSCP